MSQLEIKAPTAYEGLARTQAPLRIRTIGAAALGTIFEFGLRSLDRPACGP